MLKFSRVKIMKRAVDAINGVQSGEFLNISDTFFSSSSLEGRKRRRQPEIFAPCMGTVPSEGAQQENDFLNLGGIVLTLVTLHVQEDLRGLMKIF